ncbi:hypothetical protein ACFE04_019330 [Oxalis oulophora]
MEQRRSPPKHRHDGTSPLPLGMDWSPPPRKWNGRETVWPHDYRTGWSYCVTIPSWVFLPKSKNSDPVVGQFYRVQVGVQSVDGFTTTRGVLRRFNDFLKLFNDLKRLFPKKSIPPAPPKGLLRMKSRALLEERRCSLEEWMTKILSDIDLSRSVAVASFLELEAAARSSFLDDNQPNLEADSLSSTSSSLQMPAHPSSSHLAGSSSVTSDYGSDTVYETSELGTPRFGRDNSSEISIEELSLDEDLTNPLDNLVKYGMSNIDEGLFMGQTILDQLEGLPKNRTRVRLVNNKEASNGNGLDLFADSDPGKMIDLVQRLSTESVGSDLSSLKGSEMSNHAILNSSGNGSPDFPRGSESSGNVEISGSTNSQSSNDAHVILPVKQRNALNRTLLTMQRRLTTAKTDMEDLSARFNQEMAVKDYLATRVKDLEVELETTKLKGRENLEQAIMLERERCTQMQWEMEELRRKSLETELQLKSQQDEKVGPESSRISAIKERDTTLEELNATKERLENLTKQYAELEARSKADIKVLVKEVKSLRNSQSVLKKEFSESQTEKSETERLLEQQRQTNENARTARRKLIHECRILRRLQECNINVSTEDQCNLITDSSSLEDALGLLTTSDDQISLILSTAHQLAEVGEASMTTNNDSDHVNNNMSLDEELRKMIADIIADNAKLRSQVNSVVHAVLRRHKKELSET